MYVVVIAIMSKSCCFALVWAVICLSLEADAQPTVDETITCRPSSFMLEKVANKITSNQQENVIEIRDEIRDVKKMIAAGSDETNETTLEEVAEKIKHEIGLLGDKISRT